MNLRVLLAQRKDLLRIKFSSDKLGDIDVDLFEELNFSIEKGLGEHIEVQAGMCAWWGIMAQVADSELKEFEQDYDAWHTPRYEKEYDRLWREMDYKTSQKPNINSVDNAVKIRHRNAYNLWQGKLRDARLRASILKDAVKWWSEKGQMLVQAAKIKVTEMGTTDFIQRISEDKDKERVETLKSRMKKTKR